MSSESLLPKTAYATDRNLRAARTQNSGSSRFMWILVAQYAPGLTPTPYAKSEKGHTSGLPMPGGIIRAEGANWPECPPQMRWR